MSRKRIAAWLLVGGCMGGSACADIYTHTAEDGTVSLTNVPTDARYTLLVGSPRNAPDARPGTVAGAPGKPYEQVIEEVSRAHGLDRALLHAVIAVESGYNAQARSRKGASGLMQLMPETVRRYGVADAFDPRQNLDGGARYLHDLLRLFNNDVSLALAAYNAGENAVMKHGKRIPPYPETLRYVPRVLEAYQQYQKES